MLNEPFPRMLKIKLNNATIQVAEGTKLLEAAAREGITIPAMCMNGELEHFTSCMVCLVKDQNTGKLIPSCSAKVADGMDIITMDDEIAEARKIALELLLSEHIGDCEAPCRIACPAFMDIPQMNRLIASGHTRQALEVVYRDIALPAVLGRICPAPCENACKRKPIDEPVAICLLKRFAADNASYEFEQTKPFTGKKVAIIGAGPAGLSAASYLQTNGIQATVFDNNPLPGGALRYAISDDVLDKIVLDNEIEIIRKSGVVFHQNQQIGQKEFEELTKTYDAVVVACGNYSEAMDNWGLENNGKQLIINKSNFQTNVANVFAVGNVNRPARLAIRSAAQGKDVAVSILQFLKGEAVTGVTKRFNSSFGKLLQSEYSEYLKEASSDKRQITNENEGFSTEMAKKEADRCMHCDCRKADNCLLRDYSDAYHASKNRFNFVQRKQLTKNLQHELIVYEPGKCIKCGICVRLTSKYKEKFGFTFIGRGFDVEIKVPFNESLNKALEKTAIIVCDACPTGALAKR
jgi:ferredoxin